MDYTITAQVYQTSQDTFFHLAEKSAQADGRWGEVDGKHVLTLGASGSDKSGTLRFVSDSGETFTVTLGIKNDQRWGDVGTSCAVGTRETVAFPIWSYVASAIAGVLVPLTAPRFFGWFPFSMNRVVMIPIYAVAACCLCYGVLALAANTGLKSVQRQEASYSVTNHKGRSFAYHYTVGEGNDLKVNIIIG